jgi:hypothetical protein
MIGSVYELDITEGEIISDALMIGAKANGAITYQDLRGMSVQDYLGTVEAVRRQPEQGDDDVEE